MHSFADTILACLDYIAFSSSRGGYTSVMAIDTVLVPNDTSSNPVTHIYSIALGHCSLVELLSYSWRALEDQLPRLCEISVAVSSVHPSQTCSSVLHCLRSSLSRSRIKVKPTAFGAYTALWSVDRKLFTKNRRDRDPRLESACPYVMSVFLTSILF